MDTSAEIRFDNWTLRGQPRELLQDGPRHGYRFMGTVLPPESPAPVVVDPAGVKPAWGVIAALVLIVGIGAVIWSVRHDGSTADRASLQGAARAIAVLPFVDLSAEQDQQYFSDGLTEELISHLAAELPLRVIARTSSFSFKGENVDIATVASKLGVSHVLEGSVRKSGDQVRITAQLIDATTSSHLWSQSYDRKLDDLLKVQDEIAQAVASALQVALSAPRSPAAPHDARVYEQLFGGRFFFQRRGPGDLERAREYYERAIAIDADFAPAWAGLAGVHWISIASGTISLEAGREKVREAAQRALQLDPNLAEAHLRMTNYFASIGNEQAADEHMRRAAAAEPNDPFVLTFAASAAAADDRLDDAIELQRRAVVADPWSAFTRSELASFLYLAGRFEEARAEWLKVLEISPVPPPEDLGLTLLQVGRFDEALTMIRTLPEGAARTQQLALVYHALGRKTEAKAALQELIATVADPFLIAEVCAYRGEIDAAFKWLEKDDLKPARAGPLQLEHWIKRKSPFLESLHSDARWSAWAAPRD